MKFSEYFLVEKSLTVSEKKTVKEKVEKLIKDNGDVRLNGISTLTGGASDNRALKDFDINDLIAGTEVELEHTNNIRYAIKIAADHLTEFPNYYKHLPKFEKDLKTLGD